MQKKILEYDILTNKELNASQRQLLNAAQEAKKRAYAPYSNFKVACSLLLSNGKIVEGNNQENAAYPSGLCAERVAMFAAKSQFPNEDIVQMMVLAENSKGNSANAFPCGNCRQVMLEYSNIQDEPFELLLRTAEEEFILINDARQLLPFSFHSTTLH